MERIVQNVSMTNIWFKYVFCSQNISSFFGWEFTFFALIGLIPKTDWDIEKLSISDNLLDFNELCISFMVSKAESEKTFRFHLLSFISTFNRDKFLMVLISH